ncbi:MAG: chromosomal replication initiator protein DnaA [Candidatus Kapabacteria bacterium]|nr:chromosomal replication initiator protein DnaA [Candidatus Kapabacteria bacterium]
MNLVENSETLDLFPNTKDLSNDNLLILKKPINSDPIAESKWNECLVIIKDNTSEQAFNTWFKPVQALRYKEDLLTVQVPSHFFSEWIDTHYSDLVKSTMKRVFGEIVRLQYDVLIDSNPEVEESQSTMKIPAFKFQSQAHHTNKQAENIDFNTGLNPKYNLSNFVIGDSNQLAFSAATAVAKNPGGTNFNPLFVFGNSGLGKTHLLQAIGNFIHQEKSRTKVFYTNAELFTSEYVNSVQHGKTSEFIKFYREIDVLIIDDIQFLANREKTQDNFFHIFNDLHQKNKQIVVASDKSPKELVSIDERLISRFQWGLNVDIQKPDLETRMAILMKKAANEGLELPLDVAEYIASNISSSIRELEGALIKLIAIHTLQNRNIDIHAAKDAVTLIAKQEPKHLTIEDIKLTVSEYLKIPIDQMESQSRKHEIALSRQMSMYLAKQLTQLSLKSIGAAFSGRDHSTVLHSCTTIENYLVTDKKVKASFEYLLKTLKGGN